MVKPYTAFVGCKNSAAKAWAQFIGSSAAPAEGTGVGYQYFDRVGLEVQVAKVKADPDTIDVKLVCPKTLEHRRCSSYYMTSRAPSNSYFSAG